MPNVKVSGMKIFIYTHFANTDIPLVALTTHDSNGFCVLRAAEPHR